jgi:hypothetical protein
MQYRQALPQVGGTTCVTDGGIETVLIFHRGLDLPSFACFPLLSTPEGTEELLRRYFEPYAQPAAERGLTAVFDTPTWRANADWGAQLGYGAAGLDGANRQAVELLEEVRAAAEAPVVISGCLGPRDDAYRPGALMSADEAERYHSAQITTLSDTAADLITALTLTYPEEAIGIVRATRQREIAFTVETDGRLPGAPGRPRRRRVLRHGPPPRRRDRRRLARGRLSDLTSRRAHAFLLDDGSCDDPALRTLLRGASRGGLRRPRQASRAPAGRGRVPGDVPARPACVRCAPPRRPPARVGPDDRA